MEQAGELAVTTSKLLNVSEFTSVDEATSALISSLQAFTENGEDVGQKAEKIVDILNHIGNRYPVATNELADGLAASSAALVAANNSIEEQVALLSAGNATMQDISTVASGLKIVAARLRGTTTDVDDDADSAITNVSKLQKKIEALTAEANGGKGINILNEQGEYKSTYEILAEISKIFDKMDDVSSAALLELIAGKNRSSVVAAILQNGDILEDAYSDAFDSLGSSQKELDVHLDSIQGRIDLFTNSLQTLWMNLLDSNVIKGVVDAGTTLIKFLDTVAGKITAVIAAYTMYQKLKKGVKFVDMFNGASNIITGVVSSLKSLFTVTKSVDVATISLALSERGVNQETIANIMSTSLWSAAAGELNKQQIKQAASTLTTAFNTGKLTAAQYLAAMSSMGLKTALQGLWTVLKANPVIAIAAAVTVAALAFDHFHTTAQEAADAAKEAFDEIQSVVDSTKSTIQELEGELSTLKDKIDELNGKELSFADNEELKKLKAQREELEHSLKTQQQLLELQQGASNKQAVASMKAYTKAASEGAEKTQETAKNWGTIAGVIGGALLTIGGLALIPVSGGTSSALSAAGVSTILTAVGVGAAAGGVAGNKVGEAIGSGVAANDGTYDSWYETYTKALDAARADEQKALEKYQKDSSNIDKLDKWQEAQQKTTDIETEMYDHLSQMQQYYSGLEYGVSDELDQELNTWYNFLDKLSVDQGASGSEVTALDRIFGENASKEIQDIRDQIEKSVDEGQEFDFNSAIDGCEELKQILDYIGLDAEDVKNYFTQIAQEAQTASSKISTTNVYSDILSMIEAFDEMQAQSREVVHDNMEISEEYYNALKKQLEDVTVAEEGFTDAIDTSNGYVVKNASLLKKLINQSKNAKKATIDVAKAQAQLEYKELVGKIRDSVSAMATEYKAYGLVNSATLQNISTMREQLQAIKQTIQQYALLEISLSKAANAFDEYEKAKERDAQLTYDDSLVEMLKTIDEGILKNETGTEAFEYAVKAIVPEEFWKDIEDVDEKIRSIHDYIDGDETFSKLFHVDDESGEIDINADNVREFIKLAQEAKLIVGDSTGFSLSDDVNGVEDFAKALGITEAAALALLSATEKVDAKWGNILTDVTTKPLERKVNSAVDEIDKASDAMESFWKEANATGKFDDEEYQKLKQQIDDANAKFEESEKKANDNAKNWNLCQSAISSYRGELVLTVEEVNELAKALGFVDENGNPTISVNSDGSLQLTDEQMATLLSKISKLEEPAIMRVQLRYDEIVAEIDTLQKYIDQGCVGTITIDGITIANEADAQKKIDELTPEKKEIEYTYKITETSTEQDKSVLESYQELAKNGVEFTVTAKVDSAKEGLDTVSEAQGNIKENQEIKITSFADTAEQAIKDVADQLDRIQSKRITLTVDVQKNEVANTSSYSAVKAPGTRGYTMAIGNAMATGNVGLNNNEDNVIVGEIAPELVVDPLNHRYYTVGENGTEMVNLPRGAIVYNHKQTEELLKNGHTTRGRYTGGLSFAKGSAFADYGIPSHHPNTEDSTSFKNGSEINTDWDDAISSLSDAADSLSDAADAADEFKETFDWIEVRLEEINERLSLKGAQLENAIGADAQNAIINEMIEGNQKLYNNLIAGANEYYRYAKALLSKIPAEYRAAAQDGSIAIEQFVGEVDEKTLESIQEYREWVQKGADATQQAEEVITEIRSLAKQAFDNVAQDYDNQTSLHDNRIDQFDAYNSLIETDKGFASEEIYDAIIDENLKKIDILEGKRKELKAELANIEVGTQDWYDAVAAISDVDTEIINLKTDIEDTQDSINELHWEKFDLLMKQFEAISDEADNLLDILGTDDAVDEFGNWTDAGITSLGLLAQKMEIAEKQTAKYEEEIKYLNANWQELGYTQEEYLDKLDELKSGQYDSIDAYHDCKDAIVDLNKERVESIKKGIEKEIEAREKLIKKKKEELSADKDSYDFQKRITEKQKDITSIERQLAALANDNSMSGRAKRARLEAELVEAKAEMEEIYYDRSIENQQNALDKNLESFQEEKEAEIEGWEKYLENIEAVVADSLGMVKDNTSAIMTYLEGLQTHYGLTVTNALTEPWKAGESAISSYGTALNISLTQLAGMCGLTVDQFAEKLGLTTETLVSGLDITVGALATSLGLTNEEMASRLGTTVAELSGMEDATIQQLATNLGLTLPELASKLGTTTEGLAGNLNMTIDQFASKMGLNTDELTSKFGLTVSDLAKKLGTTYQDLTNPFGSAMSSTVGELEALEMKYSGILAGITEDSKNAIKDVDDATKKYQEDQDKLKKDQENEKNKTPTTTPKPTTPTRSEKDYYGVALAIWNGNYGWGTGTTRIKNLKAKGFDPDKVQKIINQMGKDGYVHSGAWEGKYHGIKSLSAYHINKFAKGTTGVNKDQWALIDELGDELVLSAGPNGRLQYISRGTAIIPHDISENLMKLGSLDPSIMLDQNRPTIAPNKNIVNTEIKLDCSVGTLVNIEHCDQDSLADVEKLVNKAFDKHMQNLNNSLKRYTR